MNTFWKVTSIFCRAIHKAKTGREMSHLYGKDDESLKSLAKAINAVLKNDVSQEEKVWVDKIESLRNELNSSSRKISITDYGAGSPDLNLTAEQMTQGRVITRTVGEICQNASKSYKWALLLFKLIREFKPSVCLELGTCLGISTAYQAAALELDQQGKIVTLEGADSLALLAMDNFKNLGVEDRITVVIGRFQDTLENTLREQRSVDFAFIDGHHDEQATLAYFEQMLPFLSDGAVLAFDDISWSKGMERAWNAITEDKRIRVSVNLFNLGICIVTRSPGEKFNSRIAI